MIHIKGYEIEETVFGIEASGVPEPIAAKSSIIGSIDWLLKEKGVGYSIINFTPNENRQTCSLQIKIERSKMAQLKEIIKRLEENGLIL